MESFTTYVLYSEKFNKIYIGYTSNLELRLLSHNQFAKKGFTTKYRPWVLVYSESYDNKAAALNREKELKSSRGRDFIWYIIHNR